METFSAWMNPLACLAIDLPQAGPPDAAKLLAYVFDPEAEQTTDAFVRRYREVVPVVKAFPLAPADATILKKLLWPLRHAIGSYCLADYVGCIALCGMVGEMVAVLLWEASRSPTAGGPMEKQQQEDLFGRPFERLTQERRVQVLRGLRLIDAETKTAFVALKEIRNKYLHAWSHPHDSIEGDARNALDLARKVLATVLTVSIKDGVVSLRPALDAYLDAKKPRGPSAAADQGGSSSGSSGSGP